MNKIKNIFGLIVLSIALYSCGDDGNTLTNPYEDVDYLALATSESDSIVHFF
ncbi:hypothetical protein [Polaribacter sp. Hel1_85]|uniref:hypothetical protein n=1 Tax=Polaribacter sp. Hel1_85 TaxID=1250005 RepID=UPI000A70DCDE|nr:hypothetical protein [Polaribacter sp. Hel1_85]